MINMKRISILEKVVMICIFVSALALTIWLSVGIITSDTVGNSLELIHNIYRILNIIIVILISFNIFESYKELNMNRS